MQKKHINHTTIYAHNTPFYYAIHCVLYADSISATDDRPNSQPINKPILRALGTAQHKVNV